jgi:hypothetical protein
VGHFSQSLLGHSCVAPKPEGFVIGADGRLTADDGTIVTDFAQKIFRTPINAVYAMAGASALLLQRDSFHFGTETATAVQRGPSPECRSLYDYARRVADIVYGRLIDIMNQQEPVACHPGPTPPAI